MDSVLNIFEETNVPSLQIQLLRDVFPIMHKFLQSHTSSVDRFVSVLSYCQSKCESNSSFNPQYKGVADMIIEYQKMMKTKEFIDESIQYINGRDRTEQDREDELHGFATKSTISNGGGTRKQSNYSLLYLNHQNMGERQQSSLLKNGKRVSNRSVSKCGSRQNINFPTKDSTAMQSIQSTTASTKNDQGSKRLNSQRPPSQAFPKRGFANPFASSSASTTLKNLKAERRQSPETQRIRITKNKYNSGFTKKEIMEQQSAERQRQLPQQPEPLIRVNPEIKVNNTGSESQTSNSGGAHEGKSTNSETINKAKENEAKENEVDIGGVKREVENTAAICQKTRHPSRQDRHITMSTNQLPSKSNGLGTMDNKNVVLASCKTADKNLSKMEERRPKQSKKSPHEVFQDFVAPAQPRKHQGPMVMQSLNFNLPVDGAYSSQYNSKERRAFNVKSNFRRKGTAATKEPSQATTVGFTLPIGPKELNGGYLNRPKFSHHQYATDTQEPPISIDISDPANMRKLRRRLRPGSHSGGGGLNSHRAIGQQESHIPLPQNSIQKNHIQPQPARNNLYQVSQNQIRFQPDAPRPTKNGKVKYIGNMLGSPPAYGHPSAAQKLKSDLPDIPLPSLPRSHDMSRKSSQAFIQNMILPNSNEAEHTMLTNEIKKYNDRGALQAVAVRPPARSMMTEQRINQTKASLFTNAGNIMLNR